MQAQAVSPLEQMRDRKQHFGALEPRPSRETLEVESICIRDLAERVVDDSHAGACFYVGKCFHERDELTGGSQNAGVVDPRRDVDVRGEDSRACAAASVI